MPSLADNLRLALSMTHKLEEQRGDYMVLKGIRRVLTDAIQRADACDQDTARLDKLERSDAKWGLYPYLPVYADGWTVRKAIDAMPEGTAGGGGERGR